MKAITQHPSYPTIRKIYHKMHQHGYSLLLTGGCVRDALLGRIPQDFDLVTDATPEQVEALFQKTVAVGKQFGVVVVIEDGLEFEIATFRKDGLYVDGRRPAFVDFSTPEQDALRRDFTVNALFYDFEKDQVIDFVQGQEDLKKRIIRSVGDAEKRFSEDKLRIIRALRFVSQLGFVIDSETLKAVHRKASEIGVVSRERIQTEMTKLFRGTYYQNVEALLNQTGLIQYLFPELQGQEFHAATTWTDEPEMDRWFELMLLIYKQNNLKVVEKSLEFNRFSREQKNILLNGLQWWPLWKSVPVTREGRLLEFLFHDGSARGFLRRLQELGAESERNFFQTLWKKWINFQGQKPESLVKAKDLSGYSGQKLGDALKNCYWTQLEHPEYDVQQILSRSDSD